MKIFLHKRFIKGYEKLRQGEKRSFKESRNIFLSDLYNPILNNHALRGKYTGYRSIDITGDIRVIYRFLDKDAVLFADIGTHPKLYK